MELNILCFIPIVRVPVKFQKEVRIKYFLVQAFGSYVLLFRGMFLLEWKNGFIIPLRLALLLKAGGAPLHHWYPKVAERME